MQLPDFLLDQWLSRLHDGSVRFDLASSTGTTWSLASLEQTLGDERLASLRDVALEYSPAEGRDDLRRAIADFVKVQPADVIVVSGASEALHIIFSTLPAGGNVVVPHPVFPPILEMPRGLGFEVRSYPLEPDRGFRLDVARVLSLVDAHTRLVLINSPHNPTGACAAPGEIAALADALEARGVQLVSDEVYWPIGYEQAPASAAAHPWPTIVGSASKALSLSGLRVGWIVERDRRRQAVYVNTRSYFTISNSAFSEGIAAAAISRAPLVIEPTRVRAARNRERLAALVEACADHVRWVPPAGGTVAFPWLTGVDDSRPFCEALAAQGVLVAPGDCFGMPRHFRLGLAACEDIDAAAEILAGTLATVSAG